MTRALTLAVALMLPSVAAPATTTDVLEDREALAESAPCTGCAPLPRGILRRVRAYEGDARVVRRRSFGLVCGRYQVLARKSWLLCRLALDPLTAPGVAARLLSESRDTCRKGGHCFCQWQSWNDVKGNSKRAREHRRRLCAALEPGGGV